MTFSDGFSFSQKFEALLRLEAGRKLEDRGDGSVFLCGEQD